MDQLIAGERAASRTAHRPTVPAPLLWIGAIAVLLIATALMSSGLGALPIPMREVIASALPFLGLGSVEPVHEMVLQTIRFPRVLLAALVGGVLGACGAAAQGLFRNPLADPGILGISAGGALAAIAAIYLGATGLYGVPAAAFIGAALSVLAVQWIARQGSGAPTGSLILAGIAVNAFCGAASGLLLFLSNDAQLRAATNWSLGSVAGASWQVLGVVILPALVCMVALWRCARALNALALGEGEAAHLGVGVRRLRAWLVIWLALGVGAAVAFTGVIGFVGLAVPHLFRLLVGPDHRWLIPGSALLGGLLLLAADTVSRTIAAPAELPVGVLTALMGAPFFLWLLRRGAAGGFA